MLLSDVVGADVLLPIRLNYYGVIVSVLCLYCVVVQEIGLYMFVGD